MGTSQPQDLEYAPVSKKANWEGVEISPIKILESILGWHLFPLIKIQLTLGYLLEITKHSVYGL